MAESLRVRSVVFIGSPLGKIYCGGETLNGWVNINRCNDKNSLKSRKIRAYINLLKIDGFGLENENNMVRFSWISDSTLM
jgi:hypothetical protein